MATLKNGDIVRWRESKTGTLVRLPEIPGEKGLVLFDGEQLPIELPWGEFYHLDKWDQVLGWI